MCIEDNWWSKDIIYIVNYILLKSTVETIGPKVTETLNKFDQVNKQEVIEVRIWTWAIWSQISYS